MIGEIENSIIDKYSALYANYREFEFEDVFATITGLDDYSKKLLSEGIPMLMSFYSNESRHEKQNAVEIKKYIAQVIFKLVILRSTVLAARRQASGLA